MPRVLIIAGPTAVGKTGLAIRLAQEFGAEIVGADSRQIYRDMPVGTAAPAAAQLAAVRHHLVGFLDPYERYSAARFSSDATDAIEKIHARGKHAIVVGGTGFYIRALTGAVELAPQFDPLLRERLACEGRVHDGAFLHEWLRLRDPKRAANIYPRDTYRVMRALEVALSDEAAVHRTVALRSLDSAAIGFEKFFVSIGQTELDARIAARTEKVIANGLIDEAEKIGADAVAATAVGYPQALAYVRGWLTVDELRTLLTRMTRRYAKRQFTWFRSEPQTRWVDAAEAFRTLSAAAREKLGWA